jgi:hypothetical protein
MREWELVEQKKALFPIKPLEWKWFYM